MMMNMFMSFDPFIYKLNMTWIFYMNIMTLFSLTMWNNKKIKLLNMMKMKMNKNNNLLMKMMLMHLMMNNFMNLLPLNNYNSSNPNFNMLFALIMWNSTIIMSMMNNKKIMFLNLTTKKIKMIMFQFIILIETISKLIQTLTLTIRLSINMMLSHIMMIMFNNTIMLMIFPYELMIIIIQSYVFFMLMNMYFNEMY